MSSSTIVVIPCFNEAQRLSIQAFTAFAQRWRHGRFLFVDDGSTDETLSILTSLRETLPDHFDVLRLPQNVGKAEAVRRGILEAFALNPLYVGFWDADLATPLDALPLFEEVLRDRPVVDIVLGARVKLLGRDIRRRPFRHYLGRIFATAVALTLGLEIYDSQCGAKLFLASNTVRVLFDTPFLSRWIFDVEILARFKRLRQAGVPTTVEQSIYELALPLWHDVPGSKLRLWDFAMAVRDLARIYSSFR